MAVPAPMKPPKVAVSPGGHGPVFKPKKPKVTKPKTTVSSTSVVRRAAPLTPQQTAEGFFRSTLEQIRSLQKPVDTAAIAAPYTAAQGATTQLGAGLAQSLIGTGGQAQAQYNAGRNDAQQHAAAFGISAGAGANPMALEDNGSQLIGQQTQAQAAAANQAAAAWNQLLERTKAAATSKAVSDRAASDQQVETSLASNIPQWRQNAETLAFQKQTAKQNNDYLLSTLTEKQREARNKIRVQERGQDMRSATAAAGEAGQDARLTRSIAAGEKHDKTTQAGLNKRAQNVITKTKNSAGMTQILAALKPTAGGKVTEGAGWVASVQQIDPTTNEPYGPIMSLPVKDVRESQQGMPGAVPKTFKIVGAKAVTKSVPGASQGITLASWNKAVGIAMSQRGMTRAEAQRFVQNLTPRPKK